MPLITVAVTNLFHLFVSFEMPFSSCDKQHSFSIKIKKIIIKKLRFGKNRKFMFFKFTLAKNIKNNQTLIFAYIHTYISIFIWVCSWSCGASPSPLPSPSLSSSYAAEYIHTYIFCIQTSFAFSIIPIILVPFRQEKTKEKTTAMTICSSALQSLFSTANITSLCFYILYFMFMCVCVCIWNCMQIMWNCQRTWICTFPQCNSVHFVSRWL